MTLPFRTSVLFLALFLQVALACAQPEAAAEGLALAQDISKPGKITLDIKGMEIVEVLKIFASKYDMNISVGKNVTGKVILFLKDVDVADAFEILILSNDLAYERKNGILNVMSQRDYETIYGERYQEKEVRVVTLKYAKAADIAKVLTQVKTTLGKVVIDESSNKIILIDSPKKVRELEEIIRKTDVPVETRILDMNYAPAEKVSAKIQEMLTRGVGSVKFDERTNKIAITDVPQKLNEIENTLKAFDAKPAQVLIDAQIIELRPSDEFSSGVDWETFLARDFRLASSLPATGAVNKIFLGVAAGSESGSAGLREYKGILSLLRTVGDVKILSSPRIMVLNNQEAKILVGTRQPYAQQTTVTGEGGTVTTSETINFIDVGIKLHVTPTINNDGYITMKIKPEISSADETLVTAKGEKIPIVSTAETETSVILKDGVTIIIGGLKRDVKNTTEKKVPVAGDIPLLGMAFKNKSDDRRTSDLVILLTPHLMSGNSPYTDASQVKPEHGAVFRMERSGEILKEWIGPEGVQAVAPSPAGEDETQKYFKSVTDRIGALPAISQAANATGEVRVLFTVSPDGRLAGNPKIIYSSNEAVNAAAVEHVRSAAPFPAFPASIQKPELNFQITLNIARQDAS